MAALSPPGQERQPKESAGVPASSSRRRACNECKQQKLRCNLSTGGDKDLGICDRCQRLGLECKVELSFQRTRKRRRSFELHSEVRELRRQLAAKQFSSPIPATGDSAPSDPTSLPQWVLGEEDHHLRATDGDCAAVARSTSGGLGLLLNPVEHLWTPGLTTKPVIDLPQPPAEATAVVPGGKALGNVELSVAEIEELFTIYMNHCHPFIPFLDPRRSPHEYYESSELLFWSVISAASRHLQSQPTLLPKLARNVTDLLWRSLRSIPYSLRVVQSLLILCAWPFPTSSSTADPTYLLTGMMVLLGSQMGLHQPLNVQDFTKISTNLNANEHFEWAKTWEACNIVAHSVSVGCGLPGVVQLNEWPLNVMPEYMASALHDASLGSHLQIERFRRRVSLAFASHDLNSTVSTSQNERLALYRLLNSVFIDLEREIIQLSPPQITRIYLSAARLHLHAFYLFDDPAFDGYTERIMTLYQTACFLIQQSLDLESRENSFFNYCPFFYCQVFVCASFILLRIIRSDFQSLLDADTGNVLLNAAISALRKMSIANNDLPARLSDVIGFFFSLPDRQVIGGQMTDGLRLQVRNRLSMSIVYDSLWEWRRHFQTCEELDNGRQNAEDKCPSVPEPQILSLLADWNLRSVFPPNGFPSAFAFDQLDSLADMLNFQWSDDMVNMQ